ncbi:unnamed protein product [Prorocentrum cordatum]|uniref:Protein S-acyltransferase n=1 Tax=Prorocentrum cordatum TaxID=2364126 RepID=A0ABN9UUG3_9DINO|nr:unnamed protein product [Polarella glacialis]
MLRALPPAAPLPPPPPPESPQGGPALLLTMHPRVGTSRKPSACATCRSPAAGAGRGDCQRADEGVARASADKVMPLCATDESFCGTYGPERAMPASASSPKTAPRSPRKTAPVPTSSGAKASSSFRKRLEELADDHERLCAELCGLRAENSGLKAQLGVEERDDSPGLSEVQAAPAHQRRLVKQSTVHLLAVMAEEAAGAEGDGPAHDGAPAAHHRPPPSPVAVAALSADWRAPIRRPDVPEAPDLELLSLASSAKSRGVFPNWFNHRAPNALQQRSMSGLSRDQMSTVSKMYSTNRGVRKPIRYLLQCRCRAFASSLVQLSCWEALWGGVCLADLWLVSSAITFVPGGGPGFLAMSIASWVFSVLAWADACVHLRRSLLDESFNLKPVKSVNWEYLLLWLWVDAVASVPVYVFLGLVWTGPVLSCTLVLAKLVRAFRACQRCSCRKIWALDAAVQGDFRGYGRWEQACRMPSVLWLLNFRGAFISLVFMAHANACVWAASHPDWESETGLGDGLADYWEAFYTMNLELAIGTTRFQGLQVLLSVERFVISGYLLFWIVVWAHVAREESATSLAPRRTLQYLRLHGTSRETYQQVEKFLREVSSFLRVKGDFELTMSKALPADLSWKVRECAEV